MTLSKKSLNKLIKEGIQYPIRVHGYNVFNSLENKEDIFNAPDAHIGPLFSQSIYYLKTNTVFLLQKTFCIVLNEVDYGSEDFCFNKDVPQDEVKKHIKSFKTLTKINFFKAKCLRTLDFNNLRSILKIGETQYTTPDDKSIPTGIRFTIGGAVFNIHPMLIFIYKLLELNSNNLSNIKVSYYEAKTSRCSVCRLTCQNIDLYFPSFLKENPPIPILLVPI